MPDASVTIDIAGGRHGGAARFLAELDRYLVGRKDISIIGRDSTLTPRWLVERELEASGARRVALNNASFVRGDERVVLLRNALHFASRREFEELNFTPSRELRAQIPVIRGLARRATQIVVPCAAMRERVLRYLPQCEGRIAVRFHPVGRLTREPDRSEFRILMPIVNSPYKQLESHVAALLAAMTSEGIDAQLILTGQSSDYPAEIAQDPRVNFVGILGSDALAEYWRTVGAVYFPTKLEAFGYPLAEARVHGVPVIAAHTAQNQEIAGASLRGFAPADPATLTSALRGAVSVPAKPDPVPFDPDAYFTWLLGVT